MLNNKWELKKMSFNAQNYLPLESAVEVTKIFIEHRARNRNSNSLATHTPLPQDLYNALSEFDIDVRYGIGSADSIFIYKNREINFKDITHKNINQEDINSISDWFINMVNEIKNHHA